MPARGGRFRKLLLCLVLELGVLAGLPMRPDEIVRLMQSLLRTQVVHTAPDEAEKGGE
jgi:hypothetical protein